MMHILYPWPNFLYIAHSFKSNKSLLHPLKKIAQLYLHFLWPSSMDIIEFLPVTSPNEKLELSKYPLRKAFYMYHPQTRFIPFLYYLFISLAFPFQNVWCSIKRTVTNKRNPQVLNHNRAHVKAYWLCYYFLDVSCEGWLV